MPLTRSELGRTKPTGRTLGRAIADAGRRPRRFGNHVTNALSNSSLAATGTGPGSLKAEIVQCSEDELAVHYSAEVCGTYSLAVCCKTTGEVRVFQPCSHRPAAPGSCLHAQNEHRNEHTVGARS